MSDGRWILGVRIHDPDVWDAIRLDCLGADHFTEAGLRRLLPLRHIDFIAPGHVVLRIVWWRWLAFWRPRRWRLVLEQVQPVGTRVDLRSCLW